MPRTLHTLFDRMLIDFELGQHYYTPCKTWDFPEAQLIQGRASSPTRMVCVNNLSHKALVSQLCWSSELLRSSSQAWLAAILITAAPPTHGQSRMVHMDNISASLSPVKPSSFLKLQSFSHSLWSFTAWTHQVTTLFPTQHCSWDGLWYDSCVSLQGEHSDVCQGEGTHFSYVSELNAIAELSTFISSSSAGSTPLKLLLLKQPHNRSS